MYESSGEIYITDKDTGEKVLLTDVINNLIERISQLESENIGTTNKLYEIDNQITSMIEPVRTLKDFVLGN